MLKKGQNVNSPKAMRRGMSRKFFWVMAILGVAFAVACTMANIGSVQTSAEVTRQFEHLEIKPNYRYWYLNQENNPYGVVGLERDYQLDGGPLWRALEPDSATFKKVVGLVQSFPLPNSITTGYNIFDHQGRLIGVWYSSLSAGITVDPAAKTVSVATATPWVAPQP
jgi:hypothetical protein